jgi:RNA polymerase sigma-70 factor
MHPEAKIDDALLGSADQLISEVYERCTESAPNYGVTLDCFRGSVAKTLGKCVLNTPEADSSEAGISSFISQLQADELFLAIACANGNERAWWEFDQQHRSYLERVARHLAKTDIDAQDVVDQVYVDLYGQRIVDGERVSKFATYSGRGSLRGWLRTVIWHSLVDLHRASHDEVSLDEMTENVGEGTAHASFAVPAPGGEDEMLDQIETSRYRSATASAIADAFALLDDHEKLLLLYYHVENLKLREIARLVEDEDSALRGWFQRRSSTRDGGGRTHESTVMRWLEKSYARVFQNFKEILKNDKGMSDDEIALCIELATNDLSSNSIFNNLTAK